MRVLPAPTTMRGSVALELVPDRCVVCGAEGMSPSRPAQGRWSIKSGQRQDDDSDEPNLVFDDGREACSCRSHSDGETLSAARLADGTGMIHLPPDQELER